MRQVLVTYHTLSYVMINVIKHNQHNTKKQQKTNTMISPACRRPAALIL